MDTYARGRIHTGMWEVTGLPHSLVRVSRINVKLVEDFLGLGDDEHPEALLLPGVVARAEEETVLAALLLVTGVSHAAAGSSSLLVIGKPESVGVAAEHPNSVGQIGVVVLRRGLRGEVRGDQESFVFPIGRHRHFHHVLMLFHAEHEVTRVSPVCIVGETERALAHIVL